MKFSDITGLFNISILKKLLEQYKKANYVVDESKIKYGVDPRIVAYTDKESPIAEQYKVLRTNLYSISPEKPMQTIVITSSQPQEGKTITSCNLAMTISLDTEKKVLLVDCDMRRPAVHNMLGISRKPGLSDFLDNAVAIEEFTKKPAVGNLFVIPAGTIRDNPSELLISAKIKGMIDVLRQSFDYIIFDTPPVLTVTDASILGSICDAVILVVKAGVTHQASIEEAFNMLQEAQARPKACIFTNVHFMLDSYDYYTKYKYTYYGYKLPEQK